MIDGTLTTELDIAFLVQQETFKKPLPGQPPMHIEVSE